MPIGYQDIFGNDGFPSFFKNFGVQRSTPVERNLVWGAFSEVLPPERHVVGKAHTVGIERDNSSTRHHLGRFTRRTKVVSKKAEMVDASLKLWRGLTDPAIFGQF